MIERRQEKNKKLEEDLRKEERNEHRIEIGKKILKISLIVILVISLFFTYMHVIGTKGLSVREYKIESNKLPDEFYGFKVVHFSDLHYLTSAKNKEVKKLVNKINELKPDIVVFTGDLIDQDKKITKKQIDELANNLNKINAKIGIFAIKGDEDYNQSYDKIIEKTNIKVINNSYEIIYYNGNTPILLTGTGSLIKKDADLGQTFSYDELDNLFTISLIHETNIVDKVLTYKPDLILAGHNNNGQIRLPLIGGLVKFDKGTKYTNKKYSLNKSTLFVSGGVGTSKFEFRLFNHPSINLYRLTKETK